MFKSLMLVRINCAIYFNFCQLPTRLFIEIHQRQLLKLVSGQKNGVQYFYGEVRLLDTVPSPICNASSTTAIQQYDGLDSDLIRMAAILNRKSQYSNLFVAQCAWIDFPRMSFIGQQQFILLATKYKHQEISMCDYIFEIFSSFFIRQSNLKTKKSFRHLEK